jgi:nucleoside-diphosphate-sugar epimerase
MQIIGRGFLARNLVDGLSGKYPEVVALAAGVSSTSVTDTDEFDREAEALYAALRRCRDEHSTLLFFSTASFAMYGTTLAPAPEDGPLFPPSVYGRHKLALEACVQAAGIDYLILRLSHVVGEHQRQHQLLPSIVRQIKTGKVTVYGGAHRDLLDIRDLTYVIDRLLGDGVRNVVVNVASGLPQSVDDIVDGVARRMARDAQRDYLPGEVSVTEVSLRRLLTLVPDFDGGRGGAAAYLDQMLDRYLTEVTSPGAVEPAPLSNRIVS